ncbi:MAG: hypothetical protein CMJ18_14185 [Phycisphaeraceae bacterium]|nr:hypothetical protein [Phycisphaeraceae bacterium]
MSGKNLFINLTPRFIEVVVPDARSRNLRVGASPVEDATWPELAAIAWQPLVKLVEEHGLEGRTAVVLYRSPTTTCQLSSVASSSRRHGIAAARMAAQGSIRFGRDDTVIDAAHIGRDSKRQDARIHFVTAADRCDATEAISSLVESAGLIVDSILPLEGIVIHHLVQRAIRHGGAPGAGCTSARTAPASSWRVKGGSSCFGRSAWAWTR